MKNVIQSVGVVHKIDMEHENKRLAEAVLWFSEDSEDSELDI